MFINDLLDADAASQVQAMSCSKAKDHVKSLGFIVYEYVYPGCRMSSKVCFFC